MTNNFGKSFSNNYSNANYTETTIKLLSSLKKLPVCYVTTNKKEANVRCPACGDSKKSSKSAHLYIKICPDKGEPYKYYCQKCKNKGIVTPEFLKDLKIFDSELNLSILDYNKNIYGYESSVKRINKKEIVIPISDNYDNINKEKLHYINTRLGTNLTVTDLGQYKIVLNLYEFLNFNDIRFLTNKNKNFTDQLDDFFVGFLSYDNNYLILRNTNPNACSIRYHNYNIYNNYDNSKKFYIMPGKIDRLQKQVTLILAEGFFDILGVYFNVEKENKNFIYASINGIGYNGVIREIVKMGFLDLYVKIYSDKDQTIDQYKKIFYEFKPFITKMDIIYNNLSKDFGDITKGIEVSKCCHII